MGGPGISRISLVLSAVFLALLLASSASAWYSLEGSGGGSDGYLPDDPASSNVDMNSYDIVDTSDNQVSVNDDLDVTGQLSAGSTECGSSEALLGDGTCGATGGSDGYLPDDPASSNVDMNNKNITNTDSVDAKNVSASQKFRFPVGSDMY